MDLRIAIGEYIAERGIIKKHIAEKAGIDVASFSQILNLRRKLMAEEYVAICDALQVPYDTFVKRAA